MSGEWTFHHGAFVPTKQVALSSSTQALHYGTGVFEGIRCYRSASVPGVSHLISVLAHYRRFLDSARLLRLEVPYSVGELVDITVELLRRNGHDGDSYIRPLAYKSAADPGSKPGVRLRGVSTELSIMSMPMPKYTNPAGIRCGVSSWRRIPDASLPARGKICGAYANNALAVDEAEAAGFDDAVFLNHRGEVAEASTSNLFLVRGGVVSTPGADADILEGITRGTAIELLAEQARAEVRERGIVRSELYSADEIFLTGTGTEIVPVVEIDGRRIGGGEPGPLTRLVQNAYENLVRGADRRHADKLTPVVFSGSEVSA